MPYVLLFFSGIAGLIYEVIWVREFGNAFSNTVYSATLVTAVFMLGLGVGSYLVGRWADNQYAAKPDSLLRWYGYAELSIATLGLAVSLLLPQLAAISATVSSYTVDAHHWYVLSTSSYVARALIAVVLLAPITFLMGGTLTLLIRHLVRTNPHLESSRIALLYGANTFGAALGALLTDFLLVPTVGHRGTQLVAVALNVATGAVALTLGTPRTSNLREPAAAISHELKRAAAVRLPSSVAPLVVPADAVPTALGVTALAIALSGFAAMGMEILWFRHFTLLLGGFRAVFSLLLTVILAGTGMGSLAGSVVIRRTTRPANWLIATLALFVAATLVGLATTSLTGIDAAALIVRGPDQQQPLTAMAEFWLNLQPIMFEVGVPALLLGFTYPLANATIQRAEHAVGHRAGALYLANTVGATLGVLATGFLLLPGVGMQLTATVLMAVGMCAAVPLVVASRTDSAAAPMRWPAIGMLATAAALAGVVFVGWLRLPSDYLIQHATSRNDPSERVLARTEGVNEVIVVTEMPGEGRQLHTNGHPMSFTNFMGQRYMHALAEIPLLLVERPERVLVIGFGVGNTAYAATLDARVHHVDIADLSEQVLEHAGYFESTNKDVLANPKVSVYVNDGREHLRMQPPASYDVITLEPPPLGLAGISALYSREFYDLARTRLKPNGYLSQWLPQYQVSFETLQGMVRAFLDVFPNAVLIGGTDEELLLVGSNDGVNQIDPYRLQKVLAQAPAMRADLERFGLGTVRDIVGTCVASPKTLAAATKEATAERDDYPEQEYDTASRVGWVHRDGVPAPLLDPGAAAAWCPRCFEGGQPIALVDGLDSYLALLGPLYRFEPPPASGPGSLADAKTTQMVQDSPFLHELLKQRATKYNEQGSALASSGRMDEAIAELRTGLRFNPNSAALFWNLGRALVEHGAVQEGVDDLRRSIAIDPTQGPPHYDLASTLLDLRRFDEAVDEFRTAITLMPNSVDAHNNLGIALGSEGRLGEAIEQFQDALKLSPEDTKVQHNLQSALQASRRH